MQVQGVRLRKVTSLGSNLASVTNLKEIQTPHRLWCDFGTFTTRWSGGRVQAWVQVWAPAGHLTISPKAVPEGNRRFRGQNQRPSSWGRSSALLAHNAQVGRASTNTGCFRVGGSRCGPRPACLRAATSHFFFSCEMKISMESAKSCCRPKPRPLLRSIFRSVLGLWKQNYIGTKPRVLIRILCKVKIFQLQFMSNARRCIDQTFAFKNSGISCLASIFRTAVLSFAYRTAVLGLSCTQKNRLQVAKYNESYTGFFSSYWYEQMA